MSAQIPDSLKPEIDRLVEQIGDEIAALAEQKLEYDRASAGLQKSIDGLEDLRKRLGAGSTNGKGAPRRPRQSSMDKVVRYQQTFAPGAREHLDVLQISVGTGLSEVTVKNVLDVLANNPIEAQVRKALVDEG